jgi:IS6 family transposase
LQQVGGLAAHIDGVGGHAEPDAAALIRVWVVGSVALGVSGPLQQTEPVINSTSASSPPAGYRFSREVIALSVRWYLRYGLSYREVEELLTDRGIVVDHVTIYRWVQTFTAEFIHAADQHGQVIDVLLSDRRDGPPARAFFTRALKFGAVPIEVTSDRAPVYPRIIDDLAPQARHMLEQYANNRIESDHGRLKARLRPMRGLKHLSSATTTAAGHAFVHNLRQGHYELTTDLPPPDRVRNAFTELATCL